MSYTHRQTPTHGTFKSLLSGREFTYERYGRNGPASKRAALDQMAAHHREIEASETAKYGRTLSLRERVHGLPAVETRTLREQIEQDAVHHQQPTMTGNPYSERLATLNKQLLSATRRDRAKIERRIAVLQDASDRWSEEEASRKAQQELLESLPVKAEIEKAQARLDTLLADPTCSDVEIAEAKLQLDSLKKTGDVESYRTAKKDTDEKRKELALQRRDEMERRIAEIKAEYMEGGIGEATNNLAESAPIVE